jgi:hypothetical protein
LFLSSCPPSSEISWQEGAKAYLNLTILCSMHCLQSTEKCINITRDFLKF